METVYDERRLRLRAFLYEHHTLYTHGMCAYLHTFVRVARTNQKTLLILIYARDKSVHMFAARSAVRPRCARRVCESIKCLTLGGTCRNAPPQRCVCVCVCRHRAAGDALRCHHAALSSRLPPAVRSLVRSLVSLLSHTIHTISNR